MEDNILIEAEFEYIKRLVITEFILGLIGIIGGILMFGWYTLIGIPAGISCLYQAYKYHNAKNQKLIITDNCIYGNTPKEEFNIPISKTTTANMSKNKELSIVMPSKKLKFYSCINNKDVYNVLINLTKNDKLEKKTTYDSTTQAIKNYKELLDMGAITQEEFDAKKKELLNL